MIYDTKYIIDVQSMQMERLAEQKKSEYTSFQWGLLLEVYEEYLKFSSFEVTREKMQLDFKKLIDRFEEIHSFLMIDNRGSGLTLKEYHDNRRKAAALQVKADQPGQASLIIQRGGRRKGAGRKKSPYEQRKVSLALDPDCWEIIDKLRDAKNANQSDILRELIEKSLTTEGID